MKRVGIILIGLLLIVAGLVFGPANIIVANIGLVVGIGLVVSVGIFTLSDIVVRIKDVEEKEKGHE